MFGDTTLKSAAHTGGAKRDAESAFPQTSQFRANPNDATDGPLLPACLDEVCPCHGPERVGQNIAQLGTHFWAQRVQEG